MPDLTSFDTRYISLSSISSLMVESFVPKSFIYAGIILILLSMRRLPQDPIFLLLKTMRRDNWQVWTFDWYEHIATSRYYEIKVQLYLKISVKFDRSMTIFKPNHNHKSVNNSSPFLGQFDKIYIIPETFLL